MINKENSQDLIRRYYEPHRYYHNYSHIRDLLNKLEFYKDLIAENQYENVRTAIWYHDAIYDPTSSTNEQDSADLYRKVQHWGGSIVKAMILSTKDHVLPDPKIFMYSKEARDACAIFQSLDLSGFADIQEMEKNSINIRHEFVHLTDEQWFETRIKFLSDLLNKTIFPDEFLNSIWESSAKKNIESELELINRNQDLLVLKYLAKRKDSNLKSPTNDPQTLPLVEAIARAICANLGDEWALAFDDQQQQRICAAPDGSYRDVNRPQKSDYIDTALAALSAIDAAGMAVVPRVQTEEMLRAADEAEGSVDYKVALRNEWSAMIAAAEKVSKGHLKIG